MTALTDPSTTLYILLGTIVVVLAALWARNRTRSNLVQLGIGVGALAAVFLADRFVESPREQAVRKMQEIARATQERRMDDAFRNVSESFNYNGITKAALREKARWAEGQSSFQGVSAVAFDREHDKQIDDKTVEIGFEIFLTGFPLPDWRYYCLARFAQDPDGEYRLRGMQFHQASAGPNSPPVVPQHMDR